MRRTAALCLGLSAGMWACGEESAVVVVTVEDPSRVAVRADTLAVRAPAGTEPERRALAELDFPVTLSVRSEVARLATITVEALEGEQLRGVATGEVELSFGAPATSSLILERPCTDDASCADGLYCNGVEVCLDGVCRPGDVPCPPSGLGCLEIGCEESAQACRVLPAPGLDDGNPCSLEACWEDEIHHLEDVMEGAMCEANGQVGVCVDGECQVGG